MKSFKPAIAIISAVIFSSTLLAQTAEEVITKHLDAIGGKEKISQIQSIYMESTAEVMGNSAPVKTYILNGKGYRQEVEFNGNQIIQAINETGGWFTSPMGGGPEVMSEEQFKAMKAQTNLAGELADYSANGNKVELDGKDGNNYKIKLISQDSSTTVYYIDDATYYITKTVKAGEFMGQPVELTITLSDYKKTDNGYTIPYKTETDFGGNFSMPVTVNKIEINKEIDPKIFEMPK